MWKIIIICLCFFAIHSNADTTGESLNSLNVSTSETSSSSFDMDQAIAQFNTSCLSRRDFIELGGNITGFLHTICFVALLMNKAVDVIANSEMRAALGFPPAGPWKHYRKRNLEELEFATPEEYFEFKEETKKLSLDSELYYEHNFPPAIKFLDQRFPAIRRIFKNRFNNIHRANPIDRETVDAIRNEYADHIRPKIQPFNDFFWNIRCFNKLYENYQDEPKDI
ncbi:unnamed protein product [Caenorhabditis angaria]|uniref:Uncharacterized protein n=1 Tax=Caenorhabditis angaria TaxID=860376 RepID=A0A9P1IQE3_9PELO|nr:unnamed protein product [Caenorhabditis angaria]